VSTRIPKKVQHWDDERSIGNALIVTLHYGWQFGTDPFQPEHTLGFDTPKEAKAAVRDAIPCDCPECRQHLNETKGA